MKHKLKCEVGGGMRRSPEVKLNEEQKAELSAWAKSGRTQQRLANRCRIVLAAAEGLERFK